MGITQPSDKTLYTGLVGALVTIATAILTLTTGIELTPELTAALATVATFAVALTVPAKQGTYVSEVLVDGRTDDLDPQEALEADYDAATDTESDPTSLEHVEDDAK